MFLDEFKKITYNCYLKGWNEMNGGNLSYRLTKQDLKDFPYELSDGQWLELKETLANIKGEYFFVTGSGKYFQNVIEDLESNCGLIEINGSGTHFRVKWGLINAQPTSELPTHLLSHNKLCEDSDKYRVILHGHQTNLIMLSAIVNDDVELTKNLWRVMTECLVVFPNGIKYIEWKVPGSYEIGIESAKYINDYDLIFWKNHGGFVKGETFDKAFGLIDTIEKSAMIYLELMKHNNIRVITDEQLKRLALEFKVEVKSRYDF